MSNEAWIICCICGKDTTNSNGICTNCLQHRTAHTEMKDRKALPTSYILPCNEDDYEGLYDEG